MDPKTTQLIVFIEQMAALLASSIVDLKNVISGSSAKAVNDILDDADQTYSKIIADAKGQ